MSSYRRGRRRGGRLRYLAFAARKTVPTFPRERCSYCVDELTNVFIKCGECDDIILCPQCFASGAELGNHKSYHKYSFLNPLERIPLFDTPGSKWKGEHELKLLHAIRCHGYGNWEHVAKEVGEGFSPKDVEQHYEDLYVDGPLDAGLWSIDSGFTLPDYTDNDENDPYIHDIDPSQVPEVTAEQKVMLGYNAQRDDFEIEYDDDAELLFKDITYSSNADEVERSLNNAILSIYNDSLRKRFRLKKIAREYKKVQEFLKFGCRSKPRTYKLKSLTGNFHSYQDFKEQMMGFSRFFTEVEFQEFYTNLQKEKELRSRIKDLQKMSQLGFTRFEDARRAGFVQYKPKKRRRLEPTSSVLEPSPSRWREEVRGWSNNDTAPKIGIQSLQTIPHYRALRNLLSARKKKLIDFLNLSLDEFTDIRALFLKWNSESTEMKK